MSMMGNVGTSAAAGEILTLVQQKIMENRNKPDVVSVLREIEAKATEIKTSADAGWY